MPKRLKSTFAQSVCWFVLVATSLAVSTGCSSTTIINSRPTGAKLYLNGEPVGNTPYTMTDTKIVGTTTTVRLEYPGYEPANGAIARSEQFDVGACIGGVLVLFPFLWIMGYNPTHTFELRPATGMPGQPPVMSPPPGYPPPAPPAPAPQRS